MNKQKLINHLQNDIYCRIGVSKIDGVGWIAIRDIPKGINPFKSLQIDNPKIIKLKKDELKNIDKNVLKLLKDFFLYKDTYHILYGGPNHLDITYYINHADNSNIDILILPDAKYLEFITKYPIKKGEELTINYNQYGNI